jgi:hypothetical protein
VVQVDGLPQVTTTQGARVRSQEFEIGRFISLSKENIVSTTLNLPTPPTNRSTGTAGTSVKKSKRLTTVQLVIRMFKPGGRIAAVLGLLTGGCIPAITFCVAHRVLPLYHELSFTYLGMVGVFMWVVVVGGQACSSLKVYKWFLAAYGGRIEAVGAMICLELVMTFAPDVRLSAAALAVLVFVNGVYCAGTL